MAKYRKIIRKLLFPGPFAVCLIAAAAGAWLIYTFAAAEENTPIACGAYLFSAYGLTVLCIMVLPQLIKGCRRLLRLIPVVNRCFEDLTFRITISIYAALVINLIYAGLNGFLGVSHQSAWFWSLAVYYIFLSVIRFTFAVHVQRYGFYGDIEGQWKRYRAGGVMLTMMSAALAGMVILVVTKGEGFEYEGNMIYAMALYTFYITVLSIVNVIRYRRCNSPVMSAAKAVNLASALVSMLALETAMISQFGDDSYDTEYFGIVMTGCTGGAVCIAVIAMGTYMAANAGKKLKNMRECFPDKGDKAEVYGEKAEFVPKGVE